MILRVCIRQALDTGWHLYVDGAEMTLTYMDLTEPRAYAKLDLDVGRHEIELQKESAFGSVRSGIRSAWMAILDGGGRDTEAVWKGIASIRARYAVTVGEADGDLVYSFPNAALERCSVAHETLLEEKYETKQDKRRFWLIWKLPLLLLSAVVLLPLWVLGIGTVISDPCFATVLLVVLLSFVVGAVAWAVFFYDPSKKNRKENDRCD